MTSRRRIVNAARGWIGTPYRHQAARKGIGCDCLGLVVGVLGDVYGSMPERDRDYSPDWAETTQGEPLLDACRAQCPEVDRNAAAPGDLIVFRWSAHVAAKHVAILATKDTFIHAREGHAVAECPLLPWWRRRIAGVFSLADWSAAGQL